MQCQPWYSAKLKRFTGQALPFVHAFLFGKIDNNKHEQQLLDRAEQRTGLL